MKDDSLENQCFLTNEESKEKVSVGEDSSIPKPKSHANDRPKEIYFAAGVILFLLIFIVFGGNQSSNDEGRNLGQQIEILKQQIQVLDSIGNTNYIEKTTNIAPMNLVDADVLIEQWANINVAKGADYYLRLVPFLFFSALPKANQNYCKGNLDFFGTGDGRKFACIDGFEKKKDCVILSVGCNGQWEFEEDIIKKTKYCKVHTFDCTGDFIVPTHIAHRVIFHKICIGENKNVNLFKNYYEILQLIGANNPTFLKMDIEGFEFEVFRNILKGAAISGVLPDQIAFELHAKNTYDLLSWFGRYKTYLEIYSLMNMLEKVGGYKLVSRDDNEVCAYCTELLVIRDENEPVLDYREVYFDPKEFFASVAADKEYPTTEDEYMARAAKIKYS